MKDVFQMERYLTWKSGINIRPFDDFSYNQNNFTFFWYGFSPTYYLWRP